MDQRNKVRVWLGLFIVGLVVSGLTAFPLLPEVEWLARVMGIPQVANAGDYAGMRSWIVTVRDALRDIDVKYPFLTYGTDWLAFAHLVIALFFVGPLLRPDGDRWVIVAGMIACAGVIVLALTCGAIRGIPFYWRLIDCSFGVVGFVPLWICFKTMRTLKSTRGA